MLSPDGRYAACCVSAADGERETMRLRLLDCETGGDRPLTKTRLQAASPTWSPDGKRIAFISSRDGRLHVFSRTTRRRRRLPFREDGRIDEAAWSPDGRNIAVVVTRDPRDHPEDISLRINRPAYRYDGFGYLGIRRQDIFVLRLRRSGGLVRLTADGLPKGALQWSPDGQRLLYTCGSEAGAPLQSYFLRPRLFTVDLDGRSREVGGGAHEILSASWQPDSRHIVYIGRAFGAPPGGKFDLWVTKGGKTECRTRGLHLGVGDNPQTDMPTTWTAGRRILCDEEGAYVQVQEGGSVSIYRIGLRGAEGWEPVVSGERCCFPLDLKNGRILFGASDFLHPMELFYVDLEPGSGRSGGERRLTDFDSGLSGRPAPAVRRLHFRGSDGVGVEGWLLEPAGGEGPFPTVLFVHGGPHLGFGSVLSLDAQHLASAGYAVLLVNGRGSRGYGDGFANRIIGDWGNLDYQDLMAAVDHVVETGLADPDRLGCFGLSYGGYMSCWIGGHTSRFRCLVAENPIVSFLSFYGTSDIGPIYCSGELGAGPAEEPELYSRCSPVTFAENCTTPTLLIQHEEDYRCPPEEGEQFYQRLKIRGCPVEMLRFSGSSHNGAISGPPAVRAGQDRALLEWMRRYIPAGEEEGP